MVVEHFGLLLLELIFTYTRIVALHPSKNLTFPTKWRNWSTKLLNSLSWRYKMNEKENGVTCLLNLYPPTHSKPSVIC